MDYYAIRTDPQELDTTGYMEIGPGKYSGEHWQEGFVFVLSGAFIVVEGIVAKHFADYDHDDMNDIPADCGIEISQELRTAAERLRTADVDEASEILSLPSWFLSHFPSEFPSHRRSISRLLQGISTVLADVYDQEDFACILGM